MDLVSFEKLTLNNGLDVILHQDHSIPLVSVNVWYHVGSKDEQPGKTGYAHLFEHLMFEGSKNHNKSYFEPLQDVGATLNGSTTPDRTNYWQNLPSNYLELALWLESDRMGFLLDALDQGRFDVQRDVVKNERRQSYENRPYGMASIYLQGALYPLPHPYHWPTIGFHEDLDNATLEDAKAFFQKFYNPSNASLSIAGDFDIERTKTMVDKYFGSLSQGPSVPRYGYIDSPLTGQVSLSVYDKVLLPKLILAWPSVARFHKDEAPLSMLASVLGSGKVSRLHKALVYEQRIAQSIGVGHGPSEISGEFYLEVTAAAGHTVTEIEDAVYIELQKIRNSPPSLEELERVKNAIELQRINQISQIGGFGGKANRLNSFNVFAGDPNLINTDHQRYKAVNQEDVVAVATKYLNERHVRMVVLPEPSLSYSTTVLDRTTKPVPSTPSLFRPPLPQRVVQTNGLNILLVEKKELPIVAFGLVIDAGATQDPVNIPGLANFTGAMLQEGTSSRTSQQISEEFEFLGSQISIMTNRENTILSAGVLSRHFSNALGLVSDIVKNPSFPEGELNRVRTERLTSLKRMSDDATVIASRVAPALIYGSESSYGHPVSGTEEAIGKLTREDIRSYYLSNYSPSNATLIVVGDTSLEEVSKITDEYFGDWHFDGNHVDRVVETVSSNEDKQTSIYLIDKPGAAQTVIRCGFLGVERQHQDYFALLLFDHIFGGQFTSRLNMNLRQDKGYSYGYRSWIEWHRASSLFLIGGSVQTEVTLPAIQETLKEFQDAVSVRQVTDAEFQSAKASLIRHFPAFFETPSQILNSLGQGVSFNLPDDYYENAIEQIQAVSLESVRKMPKKYFRSDKLMLLVIGDRELIEADLKSLKTPIAILDYKGESV